MNSSYQPNLLSQMTFAKLKTNNPALYIPALNQIKMTGDIELIKEVFTMYFCSLQDNDFSNPQVLNAASEIVKITEGAHVLCAVCLSLKQIKLMLQASGNNINVNYKGYTLLHAAGLCAYDEMLALTIDQSAINSVYQDKIGNTPLHLAIANECYDKAIKIIALAKEKNIDIDFSVTDKEMKTSLILSAKMRASRMVDCIVSSMSDVAREKIINLQDKDGRTALHYAMILGNSETVERLIQGGAKLDIKDRRGFKPSDYLSISESEKKGLIEAILESVSIDASRDEKARTNVILGPYYDTPTTFNNTSIEVPSRRNKSAIEKLLNAAILDTKVFYDTGTLVKVDSHFFQAQYDKFTGKSMLAACLDGHKALQKYVNNENNNNENTPITNSNASLFSHVDLKPMEVYEQAVKAFNKDKDNELAKSKFEMALKLFEEKGLSASIECGKCYSALASCFRELKQYDDAIKACEMAMPIYEKSGSKEDNSKLRTKYTQCQELRERSKNEPN